MRNNTINILILIITNFLLICPIIGQEETETLITDTIVVVKDFMLDIEERQPYYLIQSTNVETPTQQSIQPVSSLEEIDIEYKDPPLTINPIRYNKRLEKKGNDGLIKVGYGTPRAIDSKLLYTYHIEDWYQIGAKAGYSSASNESVENMQYSDWHLGIMGGYWVTPNFKVSLDTDFKRRNQGMYGIAYGEEPIIREKRVLQSIENRLGFNLSKYESLGLQVDGVIAFDAAEIINGLRQQNEVFGELHLAKTVWNGITLDITSTAQNLTAKRDENSVRSLSINPALRYVQENLALEAGIHYLQYDGSPILWPRIKADYTLTDLPLTLQLYSQLSTTTVSLNNINKVNPFLIIQNRVGASTEAVGLTRDKQIGLSAQYNISDFTIKPYYQYNIAEDTPIFSRYYRTFELSLEDEIISHTAGLNTSYAFGTKLRVNLDGYYNFYQEKVINELSYLPIYEIKLSANQSFISDRLLLTQSLHFSERTEGFSNFDLDIPRNFDSKIIDLSASVNFKILPKFWIYVEGNNLLVQDYQIWQGYDVFQPKAIFGIKYLIGEN